MKPTQTGHDSNRELILLDQDYPFQPEAGGRLQQSTIDVQQAEQGPPEYWSVIARHKLTLVISAVLGLVAAFLFTWMQTPSYRARVLVETEELNEDFLDGRAVSPTSSDHSGTPEYSLRTQTLFLQSRPVLERTLMKMDLERRITSTVRTRLDSSPLELFASTVRPQRPSQDAPLIVLQSRLRVRPIPNARVLEVTFDSSDPSLAADTANSVVTSAIELSRENRRASSRATSSWLTEQLADIKSALERGENALQQFARGPNVTFLSEKDNTVEARLRELQSQLLKAHEERIAKQSLYELATTAQPDSLPEALDDTVLKEYNNQLTALQRQLADLTSLYTPEHPKVLTVKAQIEVVQAALNAHRIQIASRIRNEYTAALRRETLLSSDYATQASIVSDQASRFAHYEVLKSDVETNRQLYNSMLQRVNEASLAASLERSNLRVIDPATAPRKPQTPNVPLNSSFGLLSGLVCGLGFIFWRTRSYDGIENPGQISSELRIHELGVIPSGNTRSAGIRNTLGLEGSLELASLEPWSLMAESFRFALTSMLLGSKSRVRPKVIAVTSAHAGEGKTSVISNLAILLARIGKRVLLIDGDVRKPRLHEIFGSENTVGLCEALTESDMPFPVQPTKIPNLSLLSSGKTIDEKLFFSARFPQLMRTLAVQFEVVLIDTPPLLEIADARLIARLADAVVLIVAQHTDRIEVQVAQQRLADDGSFLLGTILNNWNPGSTVRGIRGYGKYFKNYYAKAQTAD